MPGALGWADPRAIKGYLEQHGIECWLDIEQAGTTGLFKDITAGIKKAQVFIACVSDEVGFQKVLCSIKVVERYHIFCQTFMRYGTIQIVCQRLNYCCEKSTSIMAAFKFWNLNLEFKFGWLVLLTNSDI